MKYLVMFFFLLSFSPLYGNQHPCNVQGAKYSKLLKNCVIVQGDFTKTSKIRCTDKIPGCLIVSSVLEQPVESLYLPDVYTIYELRKVVFGFTE